MSVMNRKDRDDYERRMAARYAQRRKWDKHVRKFDREHGGVDKRIAEYLSAKTCPETPQEEP